jgi:TolA-binding protein
MTGIAYGIGAPSMHVGQTLPATSPYGGYGFAAHPFGPQAPHVQPGQQQVLQQLLQIVPQQLQQLQNVQQQVHYLQQLLQILPQQLQQIQQLIQSLPQQLLHSPFHPQPFGTIPTQVSAVGGGIAPYAAGPWGLTTAGHTLQSPGYLQSAAISPQNFGFGAQPNQLM